MTIEVFGDRARRWQRVAKAGQFIEGHEHKFDHESTVRQGAARFQVLRDVGNDPEGGRVFEVVSESPVLRPGDAPFIVRAGVSHRYVADEDDTIVDCWYLHRAPPDGAVVETYDGWQAAYE